MLDQITALGERTQSSMRIPISLQDVRQCGIPAGTDQEMGNRVSSIEHSGKMALYNDTLY